MYGSYECRLQHQPAQKVRGFNCSRHNTLDEECSSTCHHVRLASSCLNPKQQNACVNSYQFTQSHVATLPYVCGILVHCPCRTNWNEELQKEIQYTPKCTSQSRSTSFETRHVRCSIPAQCSSGVQPELSRPASKLHRSARRFVPNPSHDPTATGPGTRGTSGGGTAAVHKPATAAAARALHRTRQVRIRG